MNEQSLLNDSYFILKFSSHQSSKGDQEKLYAPKCTLFILIT